MPDISRIVENGARVYGLGCTDYSWDVHIMRHLGRLSQEFQCAQTLRKFNDISIGSYKRSRTISRPSHMTLSLQCKWVRRNNSWTWIATRERVDFFARMQHQKRQALRPKTPNVFCSSRPTFSDITSGTGPEQSKFPRAVSAWQPETIHEIYHIYRSIIATTLRLLHERHDIPISHSISTTPTSWNAIPIC